MSYVTNIRLSDKKIVEDAAKETGLKIFFRDHPIPKKKPSMKRMPNIISPSIWWEYYGSIFTEEAPDKDFSVFWGL